MIRTVILLGLFCAAPAAAQDWCEYSGLNPAERTICNDPALQWRDAALNSLWDQNDGGDGLPVSQEDWLERRDSCGTDVGCIADAYDTRILRLRDVLTTRAAPPARPWCDNPGLSATEATICATPFLADLDAALSKLDSTMNRKPPNPDVWLAERDTCGTSPDCIETAYLDRIAGYGRLLREPDGI